MGEWLGARILAAVVAVGLVVGAVWLRGRLDDGDPPPEDDSATSAPTAIEDARLDVVCVPELQVVCELLATEGVVGSVRTEPLSVTADALTAGAAQLDAWVTVRPWSDIVADRRERAGEPALASGSQQTLPLAQTSVVTVGWSARWAVLDAHCGDPLTWACIGEVADGTWAEIGGDAAWGPVKPGHAAPTTAAGLPTVAHVAAARLGAVEFSLRQLQDPAFVGWFTQLERAVPDFTPSGGNHVAHTIQFGPAAFDVVAAPGAEARRLMSAAGARAADLEVRELAPRVVIVAEVVSYAPGADRLVEAIADAGVVGALEAAGWEAVTDDVQTVAVGAGQALISVWEDATG